MEINRTFTQKDVEYFRSKVWKLIPLFEHNNQGITKYLESLVYEFNGLVKSVDNRPTMNSAVNILVHLHEDSINGDYDFQSVRKEIFNCSDLVKKSFKVGE
jgi:hypothetical protein